MVGEDKSNIKSTLPPDLPVFNIFQKKSATILSAQQFIENINKAANNINDNANNSLNNNDKEYSGKYIGFCGIGRPEKFKSTLKDNNKIDLLDFYDFPDHYPYRESDIAKLINKATSQNARLITTGKDIMRIPAKYHDKIYVLPLVFCWHNEDAVLDFIKEKLSCAGS